ncbi:MAG: hypothetical protein K2Q09_09435, partial [Phycisphaerales bacterium]|nr:hypothetical protein [Phycisphaerales bacterium]
MKATVGRLIVIGYGNMGKALVQGVTTPPPGGGGEPDAHLLYTPDRIVAVDTHGSPGGPVVRRVGSIGLVGPLSEHDEVVLAVKPQVYPEVAPALAAALPEASLMVLSVMAGIPTRRLALDLGMRGRAVRAMPNTPAQVGQGATAYAPGPYATDADAERAEVFLKRLGPLV